VNERDLQAATRNIARILGDDISPEKPLLDSRLPDGSRVAVVWPPCSLGGTTLTIRRFQYRVFTMDDLMPMGTLTSDVAGRIRQAILRQENILISGGTGSGKTTLLNAFAALAPVERSYRRHRRHGRTETGPAQHCALRGAANRPDYLP
jgi:pilus assembly protein CpaF